jgi:hypothetical protein
MPPITPIHPVQAKDGRSYRRLAPAVQELMGGKVRSRFPEVYQHLLINVKPERDRNNEEYRRTRW